MGWRGSPRKAIAIVRRARRPYFSLMWRPLWRKLRANLPIYAVRLFLAAEIVIALLTRSYPTAFIALATLGLTMLPSVFASRLDIKLPISFLTAAVIFIFATLYLGEVGDFYERYWWWDDVLHFGSAMGFGILGFLMVFMLFEGDRYAAPPLAISLIGFCVAVTIGALWEIFEFGMDQIFGLNMQKSGLIDTMSDLILDSIGAALGAGMGFVYLLGRPYHGPIRLIDRFVRMNRRYFRKAEDDRRN